MQGWGAATQGSAVITEKFLLPITYHPGVVTVCYQKLRSLSCYSVLWFEKKKSVSRVSDYRCTHSLLVALLIFLFLSTCFCRHHEKRGEGRSQLPQTAGCGTWQAQWSQGRIICWEAAETSVWQIRGSLVPWLPQQRAGIQVITPNLTPHICQPVHKIFFSSSKISLEKIWISIHRILNFSIPHRCIRVNNGVLCDKVVLEACEESELTPAKLGLPHEITVWIDPLEVSARWVTGWPAEAEAKNHTHRHASATTRLFFQSSQELWLSVVSTFCKMMNNHMWEVRRGNMGGSYRLNDLLFNIIYFVFTDLGRTAGPSP